MPDLPESTLDEPMVNTENDTTQLHTGNKDLYLPMPHIGLCDETMTNTTGNMNTSTTILNIPKPMDDSLTVETTDNTVKTNVENPSNIAVWEEQHSPNTASQPRETACLPVETLTTNTYIPQAGEETIANDDIHDKIDVAEGLLLLGTDVSSADDSQEIPESTPNSNTMESNHAVTTTQKDTEDNESDKTIITGLCDETSSPVKSPKKGVLNFRQIGIK